jgi:broad specificity phosphatase PhoE
MNRVLLVRHGDIAADMSRYWGHTDVPLSDAGIRQAEQLAHRLAGEAIDLIHSSDLRRAMDTAAIIAGRHHMSVVPCPELREINFGQCEGLTFDEMKDRCPETEGIWTAGGEDICFAGGESVRTVAGRVGVFAGSLCRESSGTGLVVAHGGSLRVLLCCLAGLDLSAWREMHIERASLSIVEIDSGGARVSLLNSVSHLGIGEVVR